MIEKGRHLNIPRSEGLCQLCETIKDEVHVIVNCSKYNSLRNMYLPFIVNNETTFAQLMQSTNDLIIRSLAKYLYAVMKCKV